MSTDYKKSWKSCLDIIRGELPPKTFKTWFEPIVPVKLEGSVLTIQVGSNYVYEYLEEHFIDLLCNALRLVIGRDAKLEYSVVVEKKLRKSETTTLSSASTAKAAPNILEKGLKDPFNIAPEHLQIDSRLNSLYTMDSFVEGTCNRLARSAGGAIALNPGGTAFNPLLLYGGSGLGKTHLAQAIGLEVKKNFPTKTVLYVSTHIFQTQFTESRLKNEINDFLHFYQSMDVLILDDIHDLAGKTATQNTFFHIFNHLQQSGKQLILTCDKAPAELLGIEDRLLTRFKWGLSAELKVPDFDTRKEIMLSKARKDGMEFTAEVIDYICQHVHNNVRELEGTMISLLAQSTFNKREMSIDLVKEVLGKTLPSQHKEITVGQIQSVVCDYFKLEPDDFHAKTRRREIVQARYLAMYFCKNYTKSSLASIGSQIGNKDHATVLYACKVVEDLKDTDKKFKIHIEELQKRLYAY
ncbi:chromosomal replication initiator protein DnaA [Bacteroidia bacterium]|nr:chromosomal replication initiator protein DnaA [Bacteroidia bacterium]